MNKAEFLKELEKKLRHMPTEDKEDALRYYDEMISDMGLDNSADVTARLGQPKDVAREIIGSCTKKHMDSKNIKDKAKGLWLVILSLFISPLALPLAILLAVIIIVAVVGVIVAVFGAVGFVLAIPFLLLFGVIKGLGWLLSGIFSIAGGVIIAVVVFKAVCWLAKKIIGIF